MTTALAPFKKYELGEITDISKMLVASEFFSDANEVPKAFAKILAGQELGIPPISAMRDIYIVKGKVSLSATLIASIIKRSGKYDYEIIEHTDDKCVIRFYENRNGEWIAKPKDSSFSMEDAKKAGLTGSTAWKSYPRNMLFARAMSNGARWHTPEIFNGGVYTPDELDEKLSVDIDGNPIKETSVSALLGKKAAKKETKVEVITKEEEKVPEVKDEVIETEVTEVSESKDSLVKEVEDLYKDTKTSLSEHLKKMKITNLSSLDVDALKVLKRQLLIKKNS